MKLGLVVWAGLVCAGLVQGRGLPSGALQRGKRDANAQMMAGHNWFNSFYTLFQDDKDEKVTVAETKPSSPKNPVENESPSEPYSRPQEKPHSSSGHQHDSSSGHQHQPSAGGSGILPIEPYFPEPVDADTRSGSVDGQGSMPATPSVPATPSSKGGPNTPATDTAYINPLPTPTNPIVREQPSPVNPPVREQPSPVNPPVREQPSPVNPPVREQPSPVNPPVREQPSPVNPPVKEQPSPVTPPVREANPPVDPSTQPPYNSNNNNYNNNNYNNYDNYNYNYNNQQGGSAYTDSGNWYNNFDTNYIYDTYNMQSDYSFNNNQQPKDWYYDANQGYNQNYYEQPQAFSGFGFGYNAGGASDVSYQNAQALSDFDDEGSLMDPDVDGGPLFGYGNGNLDASQFFDDFGLTRSVGLLQNPDQSTSSDATDPTMNPEMDYDPSMGFEPTDPTMNGMDYDPSMGFEPTDPTMNGMDFDPSMGFEPTDPSMNGMDYDPSVGFEPTDPTMNGMDYDPSMGFGPTDTTMEYDPSMGFEPTDPTMNGIDYDPSMGFEPTDPTMNGMDYDPSMGIEATDPTMNSGMDYDPSMGFEPTDPTMNPVVDYDPSMGYYDPTTLSWSGETDGFGSFLPSTTNPDAVLADLAGLFDLKDQSAEGTSEEIVDPYAIPNRPAKPAVPNKGVVDVPLDPLELGFALDAPNIKLPKEECHTASGAIGECLSAFDCGAEDGEMDGLCHQGNDAYYHLRSCCIFNSHCGFQTNKEVTYLKNPTYPNRTESGGDCIFKVDLLPNVCQVRLDFLELELRPMADGECDDKNALHISSNDPGAFIPVKKLCGTISPGVEDSLRTDIPHLYVHVDRDAAAMGLLNHRPPNKDDVSVKLTLKVDDFSSKWNIRVSQISCDGANLQAPTGCGQYFNSNSGNISSLNFKDGQYMKGIRLSSCIKRDPTACGVEYNFKHFGIGETKGGQGKLGYGLTCKDYLLVNGEKTALCGSQNLPRRMIFPAHGPEHIFFSSDEQFKNKVDVGYSLEYTHLRNCTGVEFFKYPVKK